MSTDAVSESGVNRTAKATIFVELMVVGMVLTGLFATLVSVLLFLNQGKIKPKPGPDRAVVAAPKPAVGLRPPEPVIPQLAAAPPEPDKSVEELAAIDADIRKAREARAKADLMAWAAEATAKLMKKGERAALESAQKVAANKARIDQAKAAIGQQAAQLADDLARMELEKEQIVTKLETAKNRKGYSILPYRGANGAWQRPLPIECAKEVAQIMPGGPSFRLIDLELSGMSHTSLFSRIVELAVRKAASQATPDGNAPTVYILFVVRPSGIKAYYEARARLQAQGVAFGYELVDELTPIDYPDLGDLTEWPGFVPPRELAESNGNRGSGVQSPSSTSLRQGLTGKETAATEPGKGFGNGIGNAAGSADGNGLFVWKNGLDGVRPPGGFDAGMANIADSGPNGTDQGLNPSGNHAGGLDENSGIAGNGSSRKAAVNGRGSGNSPKQRVDFGPGTLSQLGRGQGRSSLKGPGGEPGRLGSNNSTTGTSSGTLAEGQVSDSLNGLSAMGQEGQGDLAGSAGQAASANPSLDPPWGRLADRRRPSGVTGPVGANGSVESGTGTFENLVAELASQSGTTGAMRSSVRPSAVPIMPGDLAEPAGGTVGEGAIGGKPGLSDAGRLGSPSSSSGLGRSPISAPPLTLPRFEAAPASETAPAETSGGALGSGSLAGSSGGHPQPSASSGSGANRSSSTASGSSSSTASPGGSSAGQPGQPGQGQMAQSGQAENSSPKEEKPEPDRSLLGGIRRIFGGDTNLPEKAWEVGMYCDADGITIRPGEHRLKLADLQNDPDLLPRTLLSMFEKQLRDQPQRYWRPYVRYRLASGGESLMNLSQQQLANGLVRWPAVMEPVASSANGAGRSR